VYDIGLVVDDIRRSPQTYDTILGSLKSNTTCQRLVRKKLSRLCSGGVVCKLSIPGTRFGKVLFYCLPKDYFILVESDRLSSNVFYFFNYEKAGSYNIKTGECWKLDGCKWENVGGKNFFNGNVLKFL
jgi:hypothetical protein